MFNLGSLLISVIILVNIIVINNSVALRYLKRA